MDHSSSSSRVRSGTKKGCFSSGKQHVTVTNAKHHGSASAPTHSVGVKIAKNKASVMPRRYWTPREEELLLDLLDVLVVEQTKIHGNFKGGYMLRLEKEMNEELPGCGLGVKHIRSKMTVWKKTHFALADVLASSGAAGFTMDLELNMLVEDKEDAWAEYEKVHPAAVKLVKGKKLPYHVRWSHIFGNLQQAQRMEALQYANAT